MYSFVADEIPLGPGQPSPAMLLLNCSIGDILPIINRPPISSSKNEDHYEALVKREMKKR